LSYHRVKAFAKALWWLPFCIVVLIGIGISMTSTKDPKSVTIVEALNDINHGKVKANSVTVNSGDKKVDLTLKDGSKLTADYPSGFEGELSKRLVAKGVKFKTEYKSQLSGWLPIVLGVGVLWVGIIALLYGGPKLLQLRQQNKAGEKSQAKPVERPAERLSDVLGAPEAVATFQTLAAFLQDPQVFVSKGIKLERGVILYGPPGNGKSTLAKALAGETNVKLFQSSGAEFVQKFAGTSAVAVREFFDEVIKHQEPCIVYIDELDALAEVRTDNIGANRDSNTTVTQLLLKIEELFEKNPYVILIATTNRLDEVDPAVKRSGRLGHHVPMPNPDVNGREELLRVKSGRLTNLGHIDYDKLARLAAGMSGADLTVIPNSAAVLAHNADDATVTTRHYVEALARLAMGTPQEHRSVSEREQRIAAVHEAGHTIVAAKTSGAERPYRVTIVPVGVTGGSTWLIGDDDQFMDKAQAMDKLTVLLAGLAAEKMELEGHFTSGPSHDRKLATDLAGQMICEWGMGSILDRVDTDDLVDDPRAEVLINEIEKFLAEAEANAACILADNKDVFHNLIQQLLVEKTLSDARLAEVIGASEGETIVL
jgi:cell division protease FtsH